MVGMTKFEQVTGGDPYVEYSGLSTDTKPTTGVGNGSLFLEMDTTKVYAFDAETSTWYEQCALGGDA